MKANLARAATILALVLATNAPQPAAYGQLSGTVTNLPEIELSGFQVVGLNKAGQLTGFFFVAGQHAAHAFLYSGGNLSDLGTLGGDVSEAKAINGSGQIAGHSRPFGSINTHAFVYSGNGLVDIGTLGGSSSSANLVNEAGHVAGTSLTGGDLATEAFLYSGGVLQSLGTLGGNFSSPFALNPVGVVAGQSATTNNQTHAFLYSGGVMTDLGTLGGTYSCAFSVNNAGITVGEASVASEDVHAFAFANGTMTDLGTLGGSYSGSFEINNSNQILGCSSLTNDITYHGFIHENGILTDLGTLGGPNTFPYDLNNLGQVVGQSETATNGFRAFLWQSGSMVDLNTLLAPGSGWILELAVYINDTGRIAGIGTKNGISQWFIMDITTDGCASNTPPVAIAGVDRVMDCETPVHLDGSQSLDPDGDALTFEWTAAGWVLGTNATLAGTFAPGTNVVTLKVTDPCGESGSATVLVIVTDTQRPWLSNPGIVKASVDANCQAVVPNLVPAIVARDNCTPAGSLVITQSPAGGTPVGPGRHIITLTATDLAGNWRTRKAVLKVVDKTPPVIVSVPGPITVVPDANCKAVVPNVLEGLVAMDGCTPADQLEMKQTPQAGTLWRKGNGTIRVVVKDASGNKASVEIPFTIVDPAPVIASVTATPNVLTPPNNKLKAVRVSVAASDNCDDSPCNRIISITANEPTAPDEIKITGNLTAMLAASKNGSAARIYTVTVQSSDTFGNSTTGSVTVTVP